MSAAATSITVSRAGSSGVWAACFSVIEDNHIHHINNMMELGGAEIAGIKMHAAIDVFTAAIISTTALWESGATGRRREPASLRNLFHDNQRPEFAKQLKGGMMSQDIFVEVGHGPTLIDNNILLSDASLRMATEGRGYGPQSDLRRAQPVWAKGQARAIRPITFRTARRSWAL